MVHGRLQLFEFESEDAPSEANHGENIVLAHFDPTGRGITGPMGRPTGRVRTTVGAQPGGPRTTIKQGSEQPPRLRRAIPQWLAQRFARGRANEVRVLREENLLKNNDAVGNPGARTIPDSMIPDKLMAEIKDVKILALTRQIRNQMQAAKTEGVKYRIYTGETTHITRNVRDQAKTLGVELEIVKKSYLGLGD